MLIVVLGLFVGWIAVSFFYNDVIHLNNHYDEYWFISTADAICNCPIPSYLQPLDFGITHSDLKIAGHYPFDSTSDTGGHTYSTTVSYLNCDIM